MTAPESKPVLLLSFTDQLDWGFSGRSGIHLNCSMDVDDAWYGALTKVFENVLRYDVYKGANKGGICAANREILELASTYRPDYVFYPCNFSGIVTEATLAALRQLGCVVIVEFFDDDALFEWCKEMVPRVDYVVTHLPQLVKRYEDAGARCFVIPTNPLNSTITRKIDGSEKRYDATFVGSLYPHRRDYIAAIARSGAPVQHLGGGSDLKMSSARMVRVFNESRVNVSFSSGRAGRAIIVLRTFEVPLCGGFLLTEYIPGIERWFEIGKEIDCFENADEAARKIRFYLANPEVRESMAARAHERAVSEYRGDRELECLRAEIERDISANGRPQGRPSTAMNPLREFEADEYYKWTLALLGKNTPLRDEWRETARLVLETNPAHRGAAALLERAERWGDPRPAQKILRSAGGRMSGLRRGGTVSRRIRARLASAVRKIVPGKAV